MKNSNEVQRSLPHGQRLTLKGRVFPLLLVVPVLVSSAGCQSSTPNLNPFRGPSGNPNGPTVVAINPKVIRSNVQRLGINMSGQTFYDSGQMLRDLTFRNPGFEGEMWQTILQCKFVKGDSCADNDEWSAWPADFAKGGTFEFFYGAARGQTGIVSGSTVAASAAHQGVWVSFGNLAVHPAVGDFYILRMRKPGDGTSGWRTNTDGGAAITTEFQDIASNSPGKQCLRLEASAPNQSATVTGDVDTWGDRSFVRLAGGFSLDFKAKGMGGRNELTASVARLSKLHGTQTYLTQLVHLTPDWHDYHLTFTGKEDGSYGGPIAVTFNVRGTSALLDDASLIEAAEPDNPTAFRNAVVQRLRQLHPGFLRYMDYGTSFGSSFDNLIAPAYGRQRAGYSEGDKEKQDIAMGLHEFLVLCKAVKADPWISMPAGMSDLEMIHMIEYLSGPASSPYGAKRAALGQSSPWSDVFGVIHLELGNETWNAGSFPGEGIPDPKAYATRVGDIFGAARTARYFDPNKYDLIMGGWLSVPWWNEQELSVKSFADSIDVAPYTFNPFDDAANTETIFGPMFAEPEATDSRPTGLMAQQAKLAAKNGVKLEVYEVNLGVMQGKVSQEALDAVLPSVGGGISVADHMLLMLRDNGVMTQALYALPQYANGFSNSANPNSREQAKLWGVVVDMGGDTNRVRPTFLAEALANAAIMPNMLETEQSGGNPTWDQPESANGKVKLSGAHEIQSFAFTDGAKSSVVIFNLSRTSTRQVTFAGQSSPRGVVAVARLTSANITDGNEASEKVQTTHSTIAQFNPSSPLALPPFSMTVLEWKAE